MTSRRCGFCGRAPAAGFASINGTFYCHGDEDPEPTCYMRMQAGHSWLPIPLVREREDGTFEATEIARGAEEPAP